MKLGLSLSGGGVKGAAHIGALKAFEEEKINFDYISGTSSGSIVATLYSVGYSPEEILKLFKKYGKQIKYIDIRNIFKFIIGVITKGKFLINGLNSGKSIEKLISNACYQKNIMNIKDIKTPLLIPSVNIYNGCIYVFSSIKSKSTDSADMKYIYDAEIGKVVRASCSYPGVFSPCKFDNTELVDGGLRENIPWKETKKIGADEVISVIFESESNKKCCSNIIEIISASLDIMKIELATHELEGADHIIKIKSKNISLLDIKQIDFLYQLGYEETKKQIQLMKPKLNI